MKFGLLCCSYFTSNLDRVCGRLTGLNGACISVSHSFNRSRSTSLYLFVRIICAENMQLFVVLWNFYVSNILFYLLKIIVDKSLCCEYYLKGVQGSLSCINLYVR